MKGYYEANRIRLVGKGWEIRHKLRRMSRDNDPPNMTLRAWLNGKESGESPPATAASDAAPVRAAAASVPAAPIPEASSKPLPSSNKDRPLHLSWCYLMV